MTDDHFLDELVADATSDDGDDGTLFLRPLFDDAVRARSGLTVDPAAVDRLFARSSVGAASPTRPADLPPMAPVEDRHTGTYVGWPRWLAPLGGLLVALLAVGGVWAILATDGGPPVVPVAQSSTTPSATDTPSPSVSPTPSATATETPTPTATATATETATPTATPTSTATQTAVAAPVASPSPTPRPTPSPTPRQTPTPTPTPTPAPTPSPTPPPPAPSASPSPSPSPTAPPPTAVAPPPGGGPAPQPTATATSNTQPVTARNDAASTTQDSAVTVNVLANDSPQASLDRGSLQITSSPGNGTAAVASGTVRYTPAPGFTGSDRFSYRICTTSGSCGTATASISVASGRRR